MKTITVDQLLEWEPCWSESKIRKLAGDNINWSALDILALEKVSVDRKLRVVLREELIDAPVLHEYGCLCAESVLHLTHDKAREVCRNAIDTKRRWLRGDATDEELAAAQSAAGSAVGATAWAATWAAAQATQVKMLVDLLRRNQMDA